MLHVVSPFALSIRWKQKSPKSPHVWAHRGQVLAEAVGNGGEEALVATMRCLYGHASCYSLCPDMPCGLWQESSQSCSTWPSNHLEIFRIPFPETSSPWAKWNGHLGTSKSWPFREFFSAPRVPPSDSDKKLLNERIIKPLAECWGWWQLLRADFESLEFQHQQDFIILYSILSPFFSDKTT